MRKKKERKHVFDQESDHEKPYNGQEKKKIENTLSTKKAIMKNPITAKKKHALDQEKKKNFLSFFLTFLFSFINFSPQLSFSFDKIAKKEVKPETGEHYPT